MFKYTDTSIMIIQKHQVYNILEHKVSILQKQLFRLKQKDISFWNKLYQKYLNKEKLFLLTNKQIHYPLTLKMIHYFDEPHSCFYITGIDLNAQKSQIIALFQKDNPHCLNPEILQYDEQGAYFIRAYIEESSLEVFMENYFSIFREKIKRLKTKLTKFKNGRLSLSQLNLNL